MMSTVRSTDSYTVRDRSQAPSRWSCTPTSALTAHLATALFLLAASGHGAEKPPPPPEFLNTALDVPYVGSEACRGCHEDVYNNYRRMAMGRSMAPAAEAHHAPAPERITVHSEKLDRYFDIFRQDGELYQSEYALGESGAKTFENVHKVAYAVGSGVNGVTYIVRRGDHLFEAPLSYYSRAKKWALSPGYEFVDIGFNRPIHAACLACHAGRPMSVKDRDGLYRDPPFEELAIGCENCHGPGKLHVNKRLAQLESDEAVDLTIVHPLKMPARIAEGICMNCHQGGNARVLQPGRNYADFRPGTHLNDTLAIFKFPMERDNPRESDLLEHQFSMELSTCFRQTEGELSCFSCHEIHNQPAPAAKVAYYREKCFQCHDNGSCTQPLDWRMRQTPANNCAACHMPQRDVDVISHSSLTNHRIVRRSGQPFPDVAFEQTTPDLPELVHVNRPPGQGAESLPLLTRFRAVGELTVRKPELNGKYRALLADAAEKHPDEALVLAALGRWAKIEAGEAPAPQAIEYLEAALDAGSAVASTFEDLAEMYSRADRDFEALETLRRGVETSPYNPRLRKLLTLKYINLKLYSEAGKSMEKYVELFPEDLFTARALHFLEQISHAVVR